MSAELRVAARAVVEEWDSAGCSWESLHAPIAALRRACWPVPPVSLGEGVMIPDEALTAAGVAFWDAVETASAATPAGDPRHVYPDDVIAAAAPLVVATELRRIAADPDAAVRAHELLAVYLRNRADGLDPGGAR